MSQIGFGLWKMTDEAACKQAVEWALSAGYRHFDTAQIYGNEQWLGEALQTSGISRSELHITTKIHVKNFGKKRTPASFHESLNKLRLDYVDEVLLHFPVPLLRKQAWQALVEIQQQGLVKEVGVSNYTIRHLNELASYSDVMPFVNQVELHVFLQQPELLDYCRQHGIRVEAYSPLAHGRVSDNPVLQELADTYSKSPQQIMLRWCIQTGAMPLPKSTHQERIEQNIDLFDFELSDQDMKQLEQLNKNMRTCWDPTLVP